jgi:hypothetical protein
MKAKNNSHPNFLEKTCFFLEIWYYLNMNLFLAQESKQIKRAVDTALAINGPYTPPPPPPYERKNKKEERKKEE